MSPRGRRVVHLHCGAEVYFAPNVPPPSVGTELVCARHSWCQVETVERTLATRAARARATPRTLDQLGALLESAPHTTVASLRRRRFTLRLVAEAQRRGWVTVDWLSGEVQRVHPPSTFET